MLLENCYLHVSNITLCSAGALGKFSVTVETAACLARVAIVGVGRVSMVGDRRHVVFIDSKAGDVWPSVYWKLLHIPPLFLH